MLFPEFNFIPQELIDFQPHRTTVSVVIGENGSGKSTLLSNIAKKCLSERRDVIAIANTIHDKFNFSNPRLKILKASSGKYLAKRTIIDSMKNLAFKDSSALRSTMLALGYVGFRRRIGFRLEKFSRNYELILQDSHLLSAMEKDELISILNRFANRKIDMMGDLIWISDDAHSFQELYYSDLIPIFKYEKILKRLKIIYTINVFLSKNNILIPLLKASSGELSLITSIVYISTTIKENSIILIDEPENSLHPKWQTEYIDTILNIFYYYNLNIIIATHSPLIINGAEAEKSTNFAIPIKIYKSSGNTFVLQDREPKNVEEIYYKYFDVATPENRFLSSRMVELLNALASKKLNRNDFESLMNEIKSNSYNINQIESVDAIVKLSKEIN